MGIENNTAPAGPAATGAAAGETKPLPNGADASATNGQPGANGAQAVGAGNTGAEPTEAEKAAAALAATEADKDGKDDGEKNADGTPKTKGDEPAVPEAYTFQMPEGMELDADAAAEFSAIAKDRKFTQEEADKFTKVAISMRERDAARYLDMVDGWVNEVKTDKEIGGDKLQATLATTKKVMDTFGTPELKEALEKSGYGNHPAFIKFVHQVGTHLSEDVFVKGGNTAPNAEDAGVASRLFPSMNT